MPFLPSPATSNLLKLTLFVHRKPSLSISEFEQYWTPEHPKALGAFNDKIGRPIVRYTQCHRNPDTAKVGAKAMSDVFGESELDKGYEAVVEVWFESVEKMLYCYQHPLYKEMVSPDEAKFGSGPMKYIVQQEVKQWDYTSG